MSELVSTISIITLIIFCIIAYRIGQIKNYLKDIKDCAIEIVKIKHKEETGNKTKTNN